MGSLTRYSKLLWRIERVIRCQGVKGSLIWIKSRRTSYLQYLSTTPGSSEESKLRLKLKRVWGHRAAAVLLKRDPPTIRMVLTAFTALRGFHLPVKVDVTSITGQFTGTDLGSWKPWVDPFWNLLKKLHRVPAPVCLPRWVEYHFTLKAGPNGIGILNSLGDLASLSPRLLESIWTLGGEHLRQKMERLLVATPILQAIDLSVVHTKIGHSRKIVGIPDKEGKTRVIAIGDYWSQTALRPLHLFLFEVLKSIPQDMTFNQGGFVEVVRKWGKGVTLYSVDLTSATDRFPIRVISDLLRGVFTEEYVRAWEYVMVGEPFDSKTGPVIYGVGNPMGFLSS